MVTTRPPILCLSVCLFEDHFIVRGFMAIGHQTTDCLRHSLHHNPLTLDVLWEMTEMPKPWNSIWNVLCKLLTSHLSRVEQKIWYEIITRLVPSDCDYRTKFNSYFFAIATNVDLIMGVGDPLNVGWFYMIFFEAGAQSSDTYNP